MPKICHVDFFADDWLSGTSELSLAERGLYITACALIYSRGEPVEREHLHRVCAVHGRTFNTLLDRLLALGKLVEEGGKIGQKRAEKELKKARNRLEKWSKNFDNVANSDSYADRAGGKPPATIRESKKELSQPAKTESLPRARAHEADPPEARPREPVAVRAPEPAGVAAPAGPARLAKDLKIPEEWIAEAQEERTRSDLPPVDMHEEARKTEKHWRQHPPHSPRAAWLGRARRARPEIAPHRPFHVEPPPPGPPPPFDYENAMAELEENHRRRLAAIRAGETTYKAVRYGERAAA